MPEVSDPSWTSLGVQRFNGKEFVIQKIEKMFAFEIRYLKSHMPIFDNIIAFVLLSKSQDVLHGNNYIRLNFFVSLSTIE